VVYIVPDEGLLTKAEHNSLSYAELAALRMRADGGDASARVALDALPAGERRLAGHIVKAYGGKPKKVKKDKAAGSSFMSEARKPTMDALLRGDLRSADPLVREAARTALSHDPR